MKAWDTFSLFAAWDVENCGQCAMRDDIPYDDKCPLSRAITAGQDCYTKVPDIDEALLREYGYDGTDGWMCSKRVEP